MIEAIGTVAFFSLILCGLGLLADYLEDQEDTIRNRYDWDGRRR